MADRSMFNMVRWVDFLARECADWKAGKRLVCLLLVSRADKHGKSWMSQYDMARCSGYARETCNRMAKSLERDGYVAITEGHRLPNGQVESNTYRLAPDPYHVTSTSHGDRVTFPCDVEVTVRNTGKGVVKEVDLQGRLPTPRTPLRTHAHASDPDRPWTDMVDPDGPIPGLP